MPKFRKMTFSQISTAPAVAPAMIERIALGYFMSVSEVATREVPFKFLWFNVFLPNAKHQATPFKFQREQIDVSINLHFDSNNFHQNDIRTR